MIPNSVGQLANSSTVATFATIPLLALLISTYSQVDTREQVWSLRPNACGDLFAFTLALDSTLLLSKSAVIQKVNPLLAQHYENWLVLMLLGSFALIMFSGRTQCRIRRKGRSAHYPFLAVGICWLLGIAFTGMHLYLLIGA